MKVQNVPKDIDFILNKCDGNIFFTDRISSETKSVNIDRLFTNKLVPILMKGFDAENEDELEALNTINSIRKDKLQLTMRCREEYINIEISETYDEHSGRVHNVMNWPYERVYKLINKDELFSFKLINPIKLSSNTLSLQLYEVICKNGEFSINFLYSKSIIAKKGFGLDLKDSLSDFIKFLELDEIGLFYEYGLKELSNMIFNNHSYEQGFFDVYDSIAYILRNCINHYEYELEECFSKLYYYSFTDYYYFMEHMIKMKQTNNIEKLNPYYTGKDIPKISDIKSVSNNNLKLIEKLEKRLESSLIDIASDMENHPKIGIDGLNIMLNTFILMLNVKNVNNFYIPIFSYFDLENTLKQIYVIINQFDITPKNLMDRMIREMFYNNIRASEFLQYVFDYINMCKTLNISIDKKLPKDVITRHDLLIVQLRNVQLKHLENAFTLANDKNIELLKFVPSNTKYEMYCPESLSDLIEKGFQARHCVGSYGTRIIDGTSKIFFVEEKGTNDTYFVTFELNEKNQLIQAKGFANKTPNKEVLDFIKKFVANITM